jgi:hypothetical protein
MRTMFPPPKKPPAPSVKHRAKRRRPTPAPPARKLPPGFTDVTSDYIGMVVQIGGVGKNPARKR